MAEYARRVFVVKDGRMLLQGTTREVFAHERELRASFLRPPHLVQLANRLGKTLLSPQELAGCIE